MKILEKGRHFVLNGVNERVLSRPKTRDDAVTITMNGSTAHATSLSVPEFESATGHTFFDIAPKDMHSESSVIEAARTRILNREATLISYPNYLIAAEIRFTNSRAVRFCATFSITEKSNGLYIARVTKSADSTGTRVATMRCNNLKILTVNALEQFDEFISTRVQILSAEVDRSGVRETDPHGVVKLFKNESVKEYFANQQMPAGVVINQKGRYQVFSSYQDFAGANRFHYDTKDYASLKNAAKALAQKGFDIHGRQLPALDCAAAQEDIRQTLQRYHPSWSDDYTAEFEFGQGSYCISALHMEENDTFGALYSVDVTYTHEATGETLRTSLPVNPRSGGEHVRCVGLSIQTLIGTQRAQIASGELAFDPDTRTPEERQQYHIERIAALDKLVEHHHRIASTQPYFSGQAKEAAKSLEGRIYEHKLKSMAIGKLIVSERDASDVNEP